jgi:PAS domain S-box-containing protein
MQPPVRSRILIVEDEGVVATDIEKSLEDNGYEVSGVAASAEDAILEASRKCPDLVLMDNRIQGDLDGIEAAEMLHSRFGVPLIYLTAHGDPETLERAKKTRPMAFLLKPFREAELVNAVKIALHNADAEKGVHERERWFATALGSVGDGVLSTDEGGLVRFLNAAAEALTGWARDEAIGRPANEVVKLVDEHTGCELEDPVGRVLRTHEATGARASVLLSKSGTRRPVTDSALPIGNAGRLFGANLVLHDQSERAKLRQRAEFGDRLASLGAITAGVAHEINNPLTSVVANIDLALAELQAGQAEAASSRLPTSSAELRLNAALEVLKDAQASANRITHIVADLKTFSRPEEPKSSLVDVRGILGWAIDVTGHETKPRTVVQRDFGAVPMVSAHETRLGQVFVNLMVNAAQSIAPGAPERNVIRVSTRTAADGKAVIEVQDSGCGIDPGVMGSIFEPFFTTKPGTQGTGLGLSICQGIVKSLGGDIEVESAPGEGSIFRVVLPAAKLRDDVSAAPALTPVRLQKACILLIDDDAMIRRLVERALANGYDITSLASAHDAIRVLAQGQCFDTILCDLSMPDMTGMAFYRHLSQHHSNHTSRVIFLSGGLYTREMAEFMDTVGRTNRWLSKPFDLAELRRAVAESCKSVLHTRGEGKPVVRRPKEESESLNLFFKSARMRGRPN